MKTLRQFLGKQKTQSSITPVNNSLPEDKTTENTTIEDIKKRIHEFTQEKVSLNFTEDRQFFADHLLLIINDRPEIFTALLKENSFKKWLCQYRVSIKYQGESTFGTILHYFANDPSASPGLVREVLKALPNLTYARDSKGNDVLYRALCIGNDALLTIYEEEKIFADIFAQMKYVPLISSLDSATFGEKLLQAGDAFNFSANNFTKPRTNDFSKEHFPQLFKSPGDRQRALSINIPQKSSDTVNQVDKTRNTLRLGEICLKLIDSSLTSNSLQDATEEFFDICCCIPLNTHINSIERLLKSHYVITHLLDNMYRLINPGVNGKNLNFPQIPFSFKSPEFYHNELINLFTIFLQAAKTVPEDLSASSDDFLSKVILEIFKKCEPRSMAKDCLKLFNIMYRSFLSLQTYFSTDEIIEKILADGSKFSDGQWLVANLIITKLYCEEYNNTIFEKNTIDYKDVLNKITSINGEKKLSFINPAISKFFTNIHDYYQHLFIKNYLFLLVRYRVEWQVNKEVVFSFDELVNKAIQIFQKKFDKNTGSDYLAMLLRIIVSDLNKVCIQFYQRKVYDNDKKILNKNKLFDVSEIAEYSNILGGYFTSKFLSQGKNELLGALRFIIYLGKEFARAENSILNLHMLVSVIASLLNCYNFTTIELPIASLTTEEKKLFDELRNMPLIDYSKLINQLSSLYNVCFINANMLQNWYMPFAECDLAKKLTEVPIKQDMDIADCVLYFGGLGLIIEKFIVHHRSMKVFPEFMLTDLHVLLQKKHFSDEHYCRWLAEITSSFGQPDYPVFSISTTKMVNPHLIDILHYLYFQFKFIPIIKVDNKEWRADKIFAFLTTWFSNYTLEVTKSIKEKMNIYSSFIAPDSTEKCALKNNIDAELNELKEKKDKLLSLFNYLSYQVCPQYSSSAAFNVIFIKNTYSKVKTLVRNNEKTPGASTKTASAEELRGNLNVNKKITTDELLQSPGRTSAAFFSSGSNTSAKKPKRRNSAILMNKIIH